MQKILQDKLTSEYGVDLSVASHQQIYRALALICRQMMSENHQKFQSKAIGTGSKQVYYLCMEFLMGRSLKMSLFNLGLNDAAQKALPRLTSAWTASTRKSRTQVWATAVWAVWPPAIWTAWLPPASAAPATPSCTSTASSSRRSWTAGSRSAPTTGLPGGQVWLKSHPDQAVEVRFDGEIHENWDHGFHYIQHTNYNSVMAIPSDMYVQVTTERALQSCACGRPRLLTSICPASLWATTTPQ